MITSEFEHLMQAVAPNWNEGNARPPSLVPRTAGHGAREATECFSEDAIYVEPPDRQLYHRRQELYEFFGGDQGTDIPVKMTWHHLTFDEEAQIGFGEYTFEMHGCYHGMVVVNVGAELIKNWREYQYRHQLSWEEFPDKNPFSEARQVASMFCDALPIKE